MLGPAVSQRNPAILHKQSPAQALADVALPLWDASVTRIEMQTETLADGERLARQAPLERAIRV